MIDPTTNPSEGEQSVVELVPRPQDLEEVIQLSGHVARLEQDLELARLRLRDAWARVPYDPAVLRRPYQVDIPATCRVCGKSTTWRTPRGLVEHLQCPTLSVRRESISSEVWGILSGLTGDDNDENLDDD